MRAIKGRGTGPERVVKEWLKAARFKPVEHSGLLPGRPDFSLPRRKVAIFVHGCFWHGHACKRGKRTPKTNRAFWTDKILRNRARDRRNGAALRRMGWRVIVVWECGIASGKARARLMERLRRAAPAR